MNENGPEFRRCRRGGTDAHIPDPSDGVLAAGTLKSKVHGLGDVGILRGTHNVQGEASLHKNLLGRSCGAPNQDHYAYETGAYVTDLEFPTRMKVFPECY